MISDGLAHKFQVNPRRARRWIDNWFRGRRWLDYSGAYVPHTSPSIFHNAPVTSIPAHRVFIVALLVSVDDPITAYWLEDGAPAWPGAYAIRSGLDLTRRRTTVRGKSVPIVAGLLSCHNSIPAFGYTAAC